MFSNEVTVEVVREELEISETPSLTADKNRVGVGETVTLTLNVKFNKTVTVEDASKWAIQITWYVNDEPKKSVTYTIPANVDSVTYYLKLTFQTPGTYRVKADVNLVPRKEEYYEYGEEYEAGAGGGKPEVPPKIVIV